MPSVKQIATERQQLNDLIRSFFRTRGYLEVETPILVRSPDLSPNLTHFTTELVVPGAGKERGALITSPEFSMKKLLGQGMEKIFTLTKVFRNDEELGGTPSGVALRASHNPEFTMLEWYQQGIDYVAGMDETEGLIRHVLKGFAPPLRQGEVKVGLPSLASASPFRRLRVRDIMLEKTGVDLDVASKSDMEAACDRLSIHRDASDTESDLYYRLFLAKVEADLGKPARPNDLGRSGGDPVFIYDYPAFQAALAKLTPDGKYGQRFELYVDGMEMCNAFTELTDSDEQRARFMAEDREREAQGKPRFPVDEDLLTLLPSVRSPSFGNALGIDRLHMLATGAASIDDVLLFPASRLFAGGRE